MKIKNIFSGILLLVMGMLVLSSCSDDDYSASTTPLLKEGSVVTGDAEVTATTATLRGSVKGLENANTASYTTGFAYGFEQDNLSENVSGASASEFSATLSGLKTGTTIYYQAYVTLQGQVTYKGDVKTLVTTNATATTGDVTNVDANSATFSGAVSQYPEDAEAGIVISTNANPDSVHAGLRIKTNLADKIDITKAGLLPGTTYYYATYLDLGTGVVYGEVRSFTTLNQSTNVDDDFVDLGLSVKWAKRNIGAKDSTDYGGLFGFGDMTGTDPSIDPARYASADIYKTTRDIAYKATNGKGTLPTADLFEELFRLCKTEWITTDNGVSGYKVTGPNGNSIFLPAAGKRVESTITEEGQHGYYLTGTINPSNTQFAVDYEFNQSTGVRATRAVYEALAVRPVTVARNVPFNKSLLYTTWYMDNGQDGKQHVFEGPFTQWGSTDTYGTVTNNEPNPYQTTHWEMGTTNGWIGYTYGKDYGYMRFTADSIFVHRIAEDGTVTDEKGTYTLDAVNKTINTTVDVLCGNTWIGTKKGKLNILSLSEDGLQIALPDGDYGYSVNYYSQAKADKDAQIAVSFMSVGSDWQGNRGTTVESIDPTQLEGQHTFTYEGAMNGAMVSLIDFKGLKSRFPNAFVRIDDIKCDGKSIPFDENKMPMGDIEDNGNYRIELFNIWGKNSANSLVKESPFSNLTNVASDPAFSFTSKVEITYTIILNGIEGTYNPQLITINPSWGGSWDFNDGASFTISYNKETAKYEVSPKSVSMTIKSTDTNTDYTGGSIMTFIQVPGLYKFLPGFTSTLTGLQLDGNAVSFDAAKVPNTSDGDNYRLELWNQYGLTSKQGCAFGANDNGTIHELGFRNSMKVDFNINSLFAVPTF